MTRYLYFVIIAIGVSVFLWIDAVRGMPYTIIAKWVAIGIIFALPMAFILMKYMNRKLILKKNSFLDKRPPGGVWFFILMGALVSSFFFIIGTALGMDSEEIEHMLSIIGLSFTTATFSVLTFYVYVLERKYKKKVYIGPPNGLYFSD